MLKLRRSLFYHSLRATVAHSTSSAFVGRSRPPGTRSVAGSTAERAGATVTRPSPPESYSVPYPQVGANVDLRITESMLDMHRGHQWLSSHVLCRRPWSTLTVRTILICRPGRSVSSGTRVGAVNGPNEPAPRRSSLWIGSSSRWPSSSRASTPLRRVAVDPRLFGRAGRGRLADCVGRVEPLPQHAYPRPILETGQEKTASPNGRAGQDRPAQDADSNARGADYHAAGGAHWPGSSGDLP